LAAALPTDNALSKAVQDFGIGTYDSSLNSSHGEDDERVEPEGKSLPDDGGPLDPFGPDRLLSYPQDDETIQGKHASRLVRADLPGDILRPPTSPRPEDDTKADVLPTANSKLPSDGDNPSARSDYYDHLQTGQKHSPIVKTPLEDIWADEDSGAYAGEQKADSALPTVNKNEVSMDDFLGALGNFWSGYETEDVTSPQGFPTQDFSENVNYDRSDLQDGGKLLAGNMRNDMNQEVRRTATDLELAGSLTEQFLKEYGKKDITRRHVLAFLQDLGRPQYLASDIIRCLKHRHKVVIADVMDQFPLSKEASSPDFRVAASALRDHFIQLEIAHIRDPQVASVFRHNAADLAHVIADLERLEVRNG
jgi:hypothetical protein